MRLLDPLRLVDRAAYLVVVSLEESLFLSPHSQNHLYGLAELPQAFRSSGIVVAMPIGAVLLLVPPGPDTTGESAMREGIDCAGHFREQRGIAIAIASDRLANADTPGIARHGCGGGPALKRHF